MAAEAIEVEQEEEAPEAKEPAPKVTRNEENGEVTVAEEPRRRERRAERGRQRYEEVAADARAAREDAAAARREAAEWRARAMQPPPSATPNNEGDPLKRRLDGIRREQETLMTAARSASDPSEATRIKQRFYELEDERESVITDRAEERLRAKLAREQPQGGAQYEEHILRTEYEDVVAHPQAMQWAVGTYEQMVAEGKPRTLSTRRAAMQKAAERWELRKPSMPAPSASTQQRFGAVPAQAGGRAATSDVRLNKDQQRIALARWPQDDENVAYSKMAAVLRKAEVDSE